MVTDNSTNVAVAAIPHILKVDTRNYYTRRLDHLNSPSPYKLLCERAFTKER